MMLFLAFILIVQAMDVHPVSKVTAVDVEVKERVKVMVRMEPVKMPEVFVLKEPNRLVFDFKDTLLLCGPQEIEVGKMGLLRVRAAQYMSTHLKEPEDVTRVVFDVKEFAEYKIEEVPSHLLIEFGPPIPKEVKKPEIISLEFVDAPIRDVLRTISYKVGVNILPAAEVTGNVTARLVNVHWKVALESVLRSIGYTFVEEDGIIRVDTIEKIQREEIKTKVFTLNYIDAERMQETIAPVLTPEVGRVSINTATNSIIISDNPRVLRKVEDIIASLDVRTPQILIEAKIVKLSMEAAKEIGSEWFVDDFHWSGSEDEQKEEGHRHGADDFHGHGRGAGFSPSKPHSLLPQPWISPGGGWLRVGIMEKGKYFLDARLSALISEKKAELLASPKVVALNGQQAKIIVGDRVPYKTAVTTEVGAYEEVEFEEIGIKLLVTPTVSADGYINLRIHPEISSIKGYTPQNLPIKDTCEADCQVMIKSGQTVVVGGMIRDEEIKSVWKVPLLGDIPILGYLFKKKVKSKEKKEIIIIITPTMLSA